MYIHTFIISQLLYLPVYLTTNLLFMCCHGNYKTMTIRYRSPQIMRCRQRPSINPYSIIHNPNKSRSLSECRCLHGVVLLFGQLVFALDLAVACKYVSADLLTRLLVAQYCFYPSTSLLISLSAYIPNRSIYHPSTYRSTNQPHIHI